MHGFLFICFKKEKKPSKLWICNYYSQSANLINVEVILLILKKSFWKKKKNTKDFNFSKRFCKNVTLIKLTLSVHSWEKGCFLVISLYNLKSLGLYNSILSVYTVVNRGVFLVIISKHCVRLHDTHMWIHNHACLH